MNLPSPRPQTLISFRWLIVALLVASTLLNYFDRQILSVLKPVIKQQFGLGDTGYSVLLVAFMAPYVVMCAVSGRLVDRYGPKICLVIFVGIWSLATLGMGLATTFAMLVMLRAVLGAAEPGNFPAALRTCVLWFSPQERGLPVSLFSAGTAIGAIIAPPMIAWLTARLGWRAAFLAPAVAGIIWLIFWLAVFRYPRSPGEPQIAPTLTAPLPWLKVIQQPSVWGIVLARLVSDPVWYFYLFWLPGYLQEQLGLSLEQAGWIGWVPFLVADVGGVASAHFSDRLIRRGWRPDLARKTVLITVAFLAPVGISTTWAPNITVTLVIFSVVAFVCTTWLFNLAALIADVSEPNSIATVHGFSGTFGALGGLLFNACIGPVVDHFGYTPIFSVAGLLHLAASFILWKFVVPMASARYAGDKKCAERHHGCA